MPDSSLARGSILAFDFGLRRIGVAVGQMTTRTASSLETIAHGNEPDWSAIERLVREWRPSLAVIGLPLNSGGEETDMSRKARAFGTELEERLGLRCEYFDERLSSRAASDQFAELRAAGAVRRRDRSRSDAVAARIILENWLQSQPPGA